MMLTNQLHMQQESMIPILTGLIPASICGFVYWRSTKFPPLPAIMVALFILCGTLPFQPEFGPINRDFRIYNIAMMGAATVVLAWATWWDLTDIRRETERSQVAFWLHCCAGFFISRGAYALVTGHMALEENFALGLGEENIFPFLMIFCTSVLISLLLDRRSLLLGSIMPTIIFFGNIGSEVYGILFSGLTLLIFTVFWRGWRQRMLQLLPPAVAAQLPRSEITHRGQRPTRQHIDLLQRKWR